MPNQLIHETSPYLLQHAHNPVNWFPWGDEALDKAKKEKEFHYLLSYLLKLRQERNDPIAIQHNYYYLN